MSATCSKCSGDVPVRVRELHWTEGPKLDGYGHKGLCCDCFDLVLGTPLENVNRSRVRRGLEPFPARMDPLRGA